MWVGLEKTVLTDFILGSHVKMHLKRARLEEDQEDTLEITIDSNLNKG